MSERTAIADLSTRCELRNSLKRTALVLVGGLGPLIDPVVDSLPPPPEKGPVEVIVIDRVERHSPN